MTTEIEDATCQGPGKAAGKKCGRPTSAHNLCPAHVQQLYRAKMDRKKLRPIVKERIANPEARGRVKPETAALISQYGRGQLVRERREGNPLWRGTQVILEAFARGDLVWRKGAERPPLAPEQAPGRKGARISARR